MFPVVGSRQVFFLACLLFFNEYDLLVRAIRRASARAKCRCKVQVHVYVCVCLCSSVTGANADV